MEIADTFGYLAAALVIASSSMRTMIPLRVLSISSNLVFIIYGLAAGLLPIVIVHSILLSINSIRLLQLQRLVRSLKEATSGGLALDSLLPSMTTRRFAQGETLFRKSDPAHEMFYLLTGKIHLQEIGRTIRRGHRAGRDQHVLAGQETHRDGGLRHRWRAAGDERGQGSGSSTSRTRSSDSTSCSSSPGG